MPLTPFHIAAGLLPKAIAPRHFDLPMFAAVQVAIDLEPAVRILTRTYPLHGPLHSWPGALGVGLLAALAGRAFGRGWLPALVAGIVGGASHVLLDAYSAGYFWESHWLTLALALAGGMMLVSNRRKRGGGR